MNHQPGIVRNWLLLVSSGSLQIVLNFLCTIRIARTLSSEDYGRYILILSTVIIAQTVAALSLRNIAIREITRTPSALSRIAIESGKAVCIATIIASVLLVLLLSNHSDMQIAALAVFAIGLVISESIWNVAETLAFSQNQMQFSAILSTLSTLTWCGIVFLLPSEVFSLRLVISLFAGVQLLRSLSYVLCIWQKWFFRKVSTPVEPSITASGLIRKSLPLLGSALLALPLSQLPVLFLSEYSGMAEVGYYGIGSRLAQPLFLMSGTLLSAVYPSLSAYFVNKPEMFRAQARSLFLLMGGVGIGLGILVSSFSNEIVRLFFGPQYLPAIVIISLQMWVILNWIMHNLVGSLFVVANREKTVVVLSVINAILIGGAAFIGAHYGAQGLSIALWSGGLLGFAIHWIVLKRVLPHVFSAPAEARIFLPYVLLSLISMVLPRYSLGMRVIECTAVLCLLLWLFRSEVIDSVNVLRQSLRVRLSVTDENHKST